MIYNTLDVLGAALALGISLESSARTLAKVPHVKGRVEVVPTPGKDYTIPIEAALIAKNRAPGLDRSFAAQKWKNMDSQLWLDAADEAMDREFHGTYDIWGGDIDPKAVELARHNAELAGVEDCIRFEERDLGLTGDALVVIPKSITKMRLAGAGSRYVHGGASLQEITIPLITVSKSRVEDTAQVEIDILREGVNKITTGQLVVKLYQMTPVGGKNLERTVRLGIRTKDGRQLLSEKK